MPEGSERGLGFSTLSQSSSRVHLNGKETPKSGLPISLAERTDRILTRLAIEAKASVRHVRKILS